MEQHSLFNNKQQLLYRACKYNHIDIVKLLLQDTRVDPSDRDNYAIRRTSEKGHVEVVKLLLQDPRVDLLLQDHRVKYN